MLLVGEGVHYEPTEIEEMVWIAKRVPKNVEQEEKWKEIPLISRLTEARVLSPKRITL
jgi:hypothetical protein